MHHRRTIPCCVRAARRNRQWTGVHGRRRRSDVAIKTKLGIGDDSVTVEMKTNFLYSARKQSFRCTARVLKLGRQLVYGSAECLNDQGKLLTHHTLTYIRVQQPGDAQS